MPATDRESMNLFRTAVTAAAAVTLAGAPLVASASASPAAVKASVASRPATTAVLRHHVARAGRYDVRVLITTGRARRGGRPDATVDVEIDKVSRLVRISGGGQAHLSASLLLQHGTLTIRASASHAKPAIALTLSRLQRHKAPSTKASGSTGASGASSSPAVSPTPAPAPAPAPLAAPLTATFAPDGAPILALPNGFAAIDNYTSLVKDYEFTGSSLPADWSASADSAHGMQTMYQPSQVSMTGSSVALTAINEPNDGYPTTSGWISTEGQYTLTHGLIDFRAKMPAGQGLWSGLWLDQPNNSNPWGELDVQEMLLNDTHTVYGSAHAWAPTQWGETQSTVMTADASQGYHDYQLSWQPGLLTWAVDGIAYAQYTQAQAQASGYPWPFDDATGFYLIATLAVGTANEWPGAPNTTTPFPATMNIQSVKIWQ